MTVKASLPACGPSSSDRAALGALLGFAAVGLAVRAVLLRAPGFWYDEATTGLMSLAVLRGEAPVYFRGQPFMGALDAYLAAPVSLALGPSVHALKLMPLALTLIWMGLTLRLAWVGFGPRAAAFAAALLAVPPAFLLSWSIEARGHYQMSVVLGTLALVLVAEPAGTSHRRTAVRLGLTGFVLGLAFWTNFLSMVFALPVAILVRRRRWHRNVAGLLAAVPAFLLGSLPHWVYGLGHGTALPPTGGWIGFAAIRTHLELLGRVSWPILAGVTTPANDASSHWLLAAGVGTLSLAATVLALRAARRRSPSRPAIGLAIAALVAVNAGLAALTTYGERLDDRDQKYLLPVYTALPVLVGAGLASLPLWAGVPPLVALLLVQGAGGYPVLQSAVDGQTAGRLASLRERYREGIRQLDRLGLHALYATAPDPILLAFLSRERVVSSASYQESYPPYAQAADGTVRAGWWFGGRDPVFEANLAVLGVGFRFHRLEPRGGVYADFVVAPARLRELDPGSFRVTAGRRGEETGRAVDRDAATCWSSGAPRQGGEWLEVDLGRIESVTLLRWLPRVYQEVPSGIRLELSEDGVTWQRRIELPDYEGPFYWSAGRPMRRVRSGRVELRIQPTPARFVRLTQLGPERFWGWSVCELFVYATDPAGAWTVPDGDGEAVARAVHAAGVTRLYADHGWASRVALSSPGVRVLPANLFVDAYGYAPAADRLPVVHWEPGAGALVEGPDVTGFERAAHAGGLGFEGHDAGGLRLFTYAPPPALPGRPLPSSLFRLTASIHGDRAPNAADGRRNTRWTTGRAQQAGDWLRVDLAAPRRIRAVSVHSSSPDESPRALALEGTTDGTTWVAVATTERTSGPMRWGGLTWLRDGIDTVRLEMAPVTLRGLRLTLTRGDPDSAWSVHELVIYEDG